MFNRINFFPPSNLKQLLVGFAEGFYIAQLLHVQDFPSSLSHNAARISLLLLCYNQLKKLLQLDLLENYSALFGYVAAVEMTSNFGNQKLSFGGPR